MADSQGMDGISGQQMTPNGAISISDAKAAALGDDHDQKQAIDDGITSNISATQMYHPIGVSPTSSQPQDSIAKHISPPADTEPPTSDHNLVDTNTADGQSVQFIDVSRRTEAQQEQSYSAADSSGQTHVEVMPSTTDIVGSPSMVEPTPSGQDSALAPQISVHDSTDAMDITPEVASLLPNSGVEWTATPLVEAEPIFPVQDTDISVVASEEPPQAPAFTSSSQVEREPQPSTVIEEANTDVPNELPVIPVDDVQLQQHDELPQADHVLPDQGPAPLPPDEGTFSDTDSALGGMSYVSSLTSLTDSIYEAIEEHGRTYHSYKAGKYMLPNDSREQERLDTQHQMMMTCNDGRLFQAPLDYHRVNRVLDIATGTGIWCIDFADDFPNAEVIGSDLSPIQPRWCPPNCHFEVDDAEDDWVWNQPFSYIHGRALVTCFEDPLDVIKKCFRNLEPGGWLEYQDASFPFDYEKPDMPPVEPGRLDRPYSNPLQYWEQLTYEASIRGGRRWDNVRKYKQMFEEAGFVDVVEHKTKAPLGVINYRTKKELSVWKDLTQKEMQVGILHGPSIYNGLDGMSNRNFQRLEIPQAQTAEIVKKARAVMANNTVGAYNWIITVYGRRPEQGE